MSARPEPSEEYRRALRRACVDAGLPEVYADRVERAFQATIDAGEPVPADPDPSAELLAARLEVERLREALVQAAIPLEAMLAAGDCEPAAMTLCDDVKAAIKGGVVAARGALAAQPPDLGPLRAVAASWEVAKRMSIVVPGSLPRALEALLAAYPSLAGEG